MTSQHGIRRPDHRHRGKRRGVVPRWRLALAAGVVITAVGAGAGIAFDLPGLLPGQDSGTRTQAAAGDDRPVPTVEAGTVDVGPSSSSPSPSASKSEAAEKNPSAKAGKASKRSTPSKQSRSGEGERPAPRPTTAAPSQPKPPADPEPGSGSGSGSQNTSVTDRVVELTNNERAAAGCPALKTDDALTRAAEKYSDVMASSGELSHTGPDGSTISSRAEAEDYAWSALGENIAQGYQTPEQVVEGWMNSSGHRKNILNCGFKDIGVGVNTGSGGPWWTQDFGTGR